MNAKTLMTTAFAAMFTSAFTLVLALAPSSAWAENKTYYAKATVKASPAAGGTVYVSTSTTKPSTGGAEMTAGPKAGGKDETQIKFYCWADPADGYKFREWTYAGSVSPEYQDSQSGEMTVYSKAESESGATEGIFTAVFEKIHYRYGRAVARPSDPARGKIFLSTTNVKGTMTANEMTVNHDRVERGESAAEMVFYRWAEAEPGYIFMGWSDYRKDANGSVVLKAESEDSANPSILDMTANFEIATTYYGQVTVKPNDSSMGEVYVSTSSSRC